MVNFFSAEIRYTRRKMFMALTKFDFWVSDRTKIGGCLSAFLLCVTLVAGLCPSTAQADVRQSDVVAGLSVESRGLSASS